MRKRTAKPLMTIRVQPDEDQFMAYCPELDIVCAEDTPEQAVTTLLEMALEYAEHYVENIEEYGKAPNLKHERPLVKHINRARTLGRARSLFNVVYEQVPTVSCAATVSAS